MAALTGGDKLQAYLEGIARNVAPTSGQPSVRIGFLETITYPNTGTPVATIAAIQEFGGTINRAAGSVTVYRKVAAGGTHFLRNGRFVKRKEANFSSTHATPAHTITIPPRPFFRNMIKQYAKTWGGDMAELLKDTHYSAEATLRRMGEIVAGELRQSITDLTSPPLAASTIAKKARGGAKAVHGVYGPSKPLIDSGLMLNSVDYEVTV